MGRLFVVESDGTTYELLAGTLQHDGYVLGVAWGVLFYELRAAVRGSILGT